MPSYSRRLAAAAAALTLASPVLAHATGGTPSVAARPQAAAADPATAVNVKSAARVPYRGGTDLELWRWKGRRYVISGAQNNYNPTTSYGLRVVDVTRPTRPTVAGFMPCNASQNDIQVRGRYAYLALDFEAKGDRDDRSTDCFNQLDLVGEGVIVVDLVNPRRPKAVGFVQVPGDAHNTTIHPTKPILYVSESETPNGEGHTQVHIVDVSNPRRPKLLHDADFGVGDSPHDITFNKKGTRAYVAAGFYSGTLVLNTTNPKEPTLISRILDPAINFTHQADPTPDGKYLLITDELAGAEGNLACPGGGIHVWDISNEKVPVKVGAYYIPDTYVGTNPGPRPPVDGVPVRLFRCTAHVFRIAPDGRTMTMGWYSQGTQVLDLTGLPGVSAGGAGTGIKRLGAWKIEGVTDTWSAKMDDRGYIYTGDTQRGMDVLKFTRPKAAKSAPGFAGTWLTPAQAMARSVRDRATAGPTTYFCFDRTYRSGLAR
jgi:hypothetical protein